MLNVLVIGFGWAYNSINSTVGLDAIVKEAVLRVNVLSWGRQMASIPSWRGLGKCGPVIAETVWFDHRTVWFHVDYSDKSCRWLFGWGNIAPHLWLNFGNENVFDFCKLRSSPNFHLWDHRVNHFKDLLWEIG